MNMQNLMAQAQRMQRDIMKKKEEVEKKIFNAVFSSISAILFKILKGDRTTLMVSGSLND